MAATVGRELESAMTKHRDLMKIVTESLAQCTELALDYETKHDEKAVDELDRQARAYADMERRVKNNLAALEALKAHATGRRALDEEIDMVAFFEAKEREAEQEAPPDSVQRQASYTNFRQAVWEINRRAAVAPPGADDEVQVAAVAGDLVCPLMKTAFVEPVRNAVCGHVYSKAAVVQYIRSAQPGRGRRKAASCPVAGCRAAIDEQSLEPDRDMERRLKRHRVAEPSQEEEEVTQV